MKKKILFISIGHFGSLTDTIFYYKYLKNKYDLNYVGFDENKSCVQYDGINLVQLRGYGNNLKNKIIFFLKIKALISSNKFDLIFINYFFGSSILKFFLKNHVSVIDIRSGYISKNELKRFFYNSILSLESRLFKNITIISKSLKESLKLPKRTHVLPLGAEKNLLKEKINNNITFLYVGTFRNRNLSVTVKAFKLFLDSLKPNQIKKIKYNIIGYGSKNEESIIKKMIKNLNLRDHVFFLGEIRYPKLKKYFQDSDIGVAYIPMVKQYDNQPPTKIFEYILSGMPVLATKTSENNLVINNENGILVSDDIISFSNGFKKIFKFRDRFSSYQIQQNSLNFTWEKIVKKNMIPYIEEII